MAAKAAPRVCQDKKRDGTTCGNHTQAIPRHLTGGRSIRLDYCLAHSLERAAKRGSLEFAAGFTLSYIAPPDDDEPNEE